MTEDRMKELEARMAKIEKEIKNLHDDFSEFRVIRTEFNSIADRMTVLEHESAATQAYGPVDLHRS